MSRFIDLTGRKFNKLTVISRAENSNKGAIRWLCVCECGNQTIVERSNLVKGVIKSCGCYNREIVSERAKKNFTTHGLYKTRLYRTLNHILQRCYNPNNNQYKNYGGRGITVCNEWKNDCQAFFIWAISNGYKEGLTIDRIDNNGNYEPNNCRWVDMKTQANNRRTNRLISYNGQTHTMKEWAIITGINYRTLQDRLKRGWSDEKALTTPFQ